MENPVQPKLTVFTTGDLVKVVATGKRGIVTKQVETHTYCVMLKDGKLSTEKLDTHALTLMRKKWATAILSDQQKVLVALQGT
jgi:hypothetical protein